MKIACIILFSLAFFTPAIAQTGWYKIPCPDDMGDRYYSDAQFFSEDVGLFTSLSNQHAVLYKTDDGGNHWNKISLPAGINSSTHCFLTDHIFYYVGIFDDSLAIYVTKDGGTTWSHLPLISGCTTGMHFISEAEGYICGAGNNILYQGNDQGGIIYKTIDSGKSWNKISPDTTEHYSRFYKIKFTDKLNGFAVLEFVGGCMAYSIPWGTSDGGITWSQKMVKPFGPNTHHINNTTNWVKIFESVMHSTDDGRTWNYCKMNWTYQFEDHVVGLVFGSDLNGFAITHYGSLAKTSDGGMTWSKQVVLNDSSFIFRAFAYPSADVAYLFGHDFILKTTDGSSTISGVAKNQKITSSLSLEANPVSDYADFRFEPVKNTASIEVFDITGRLMRTAIISSETSSYRLKIDDLPPGIYLAKLGAVIVRMIKL
jgi:photosystem II stability/assembly factor-like uncharacterized protein